MDKILVYALSSNIGGVEEYVLNLSRYKTDEECTYEYIVLGDCTPYKEEMDALGLSYYFIPHKKNIIKNIYELNRLLKERRSGCEFIYFNTSALVYPVPYLLAKHYRYKIILHSHLTGTNGIRRYIHIVNRQWISKIVSGKFACSTPAAKWMFGSKSIDTVKIIPNAIKLDRFYVNDVLREKERDKLGIKNEYVIGHVGRLTFVKNQTFLLKIMSAAKQQGLNYKLLLVGDGEDEKLLRQKSTELNIEDKVIFYGRSSEPEKLLACMDCFVMPSIVEGFPVTLVEAQASGLPCIISDTITKEINITGNVSFVSLDKTPSDWLKVIKSSKGRYATQDMLKESGYDVENLEQYVRKLIVNCDKRG